MKLTIKVEHPQISLILSDANGRVDSFTWTDDNALSKNLLANIDNLLKKNKIEIRTLDKIETKTNKASYTSSRIARTVSELLSFAIKNQ